MPEKSLSYDPIEEDELVDEPMSTTHSDLPDPGNEGGRVEDPETQERMERARRRKRRREASLE